MLGQLTGPDTSTFVSLTRVYFVYACRIKSVLAMGEVKLS